MGAWIDILLLANHTPKTIFVRGNEVKIDRGQFAYSEITLSQKWGWSRNKLRRFLGYLETIQQIKQQKNSILSLYTVINYDEYQGNDTTENNNDESIKTTVLTSKQLSKKTQSNNGINDTTEISSKTSFINKNGTTDDTTERQQKDINKNDKNEKNDYIYANSPSAHEQLSIGEEYLKQKLENKSKVAYEFQVQALEIIKALNIPPERKGAYFKAVKTYSRIKILEAYSFAVDHPNIEARDKMFFWKLNQKK